MKTELESVDGLLKVGLYSPEQGVADHAGRIKHIADTKPPWMESIWPLSKETLEVAANIQNTLDSIGYSVEYLEIDTTAIEPKLHLKASFFASRNAWHSICSSPDLAELLKKYVVYLAQQSTGSKTAEQLPNVRDFPEKLRIEWRQLVKNILDATPEKDKGHMIFYLTVGSINLDYRSMALDGEVMILMSGWMSTIGYFDFLMLPGLCHWVETTDELDKYLLPPSGLMRKVAGFMKLLL